MMRGGCGVSPNAVKDFDAGNTSTKRKRVSLRGWSRRTTEPTRLRFVLVSRAFGVKKMLNGVGCRPLFARSRASYNLVFDPQ